MSEPLDITVHHFSADPPSPTLLLDAGRRLVHAAIAPSGHWLSVSHVPPDFVGVTSGSVGKVCFVWGRAPPAATQDTVATVRDSDLEDWDAPFDKSDTLDLSALREFEGTDFSPIPRRMSGPGKRKSQPESRSQLPARPFVDDVDGNLDPHPPKRHCPLTHSHAQSLTDISISMLIPLPHYLASPDPMCPPPPEIDKIPPFRITCAHCPSTSFFHTPFARTAWIVPLRGRPPYSRASSASVGLASAPEEVHTESGTPRCIRWTPLAITQFWGFLLRQRSINNFGPIALSYVLAPLPPEETGNMRQVGKGRAQEGEENLKIRQGKEAIPERGNEGRWEYIKIYHDALYAMKLRSLLDSFRWEADDGRSKTMYDESRRKRVLMGARLVLVDENGAGVVLA